MAVASTVQKNRVHQTNISRALNKYFACIKQIFRPRLKKGQRRFLACGVKVKIRTKNSRYKILSSMARMRGCILFCCPNKSFFRTRCGKGSPCMVSALGNQNLLLTAASKESDESRSTRANFHFLIQMMYFCL